MKQLIFIALLSIPFVSFATETIKPDEIVGIWVDAQPYSIKGKFITWLASLTANRLEISKDFDVTFTRTFESGEKETIKTDRSELEIHDDLYIINLPRESCGKYKIVISGWRSKHTKRLFGYFYLYNDDGLFNGWAISLAPEDES
jgi:hypothetical protein